MSNTSSNSSNKNSPNVLNNLANRKNLSPSVNNNNNSNRANANRANANRANSNRANANRANANRANANRANANRANANRARTNGNRANMNENSLLSLSKVQSITNNQWRKQSYKRLFVGLIINGILILGVTFAIIHVYVLNRMNYEKYQAKVVKGSCKDEADSIGIVRKHCNITIKFRVNVKDPKSEKEITLDQFYNQNIIMKNKKGEEVVNILYNKQKDKLVFDQDKTVLKIILFIALTFLVIFQVSMLVSYNN